MIQRTNYLYAVPVFLGFLFNFSRLATVCFILVATMLQQCCNTVGAVFISLIIYEFHINKKYFISYIYKKYKIVYFYLGFQIYFLSFIHFGEKNSSNLWENYLMRCYVNIAGVSILSAKCLCVKMLLSSYFIQLNK